jgi:hypothetical protein
LRGDWECKGRHRKFAFIVFVERESGPANALVHLATGLKTVAVSG